tara:strand:- start:204 stop:653 length:450 start_codon:yes stop_codon:yes gene_type:complete
VTEISFYHLERSPLEQALPKLLEKTLSIGKRALVLASTEDRVENLAQVLWTYDPDAWLPHGTAKDGSPEDQPVWLSTEDETPNKATFLFLPDGATSQWVDSYERCFELFDGRDPAAVQAARDRWKAYKAAGHDLSYLQQTPQGGWEKKA